MNIFEALTEARIREWKQRKQVAPDEDAVLVPSESYEQQLLQQIVVLIEGSGASAPDDRTLKLNEARDLEIQLMASLEKRGLTLTAKRITDELSELRRNERPST